jgi:hypothetical protein
MLIKQMCLVLIALLVSGVAFAAGESDLKFRVAKPGATATVDHIIKDGKALVSVEDARQKPILGLTTCLLKLVLSTAQSPSRWNI